MTSSTIGNPFLNFKARTFVIVSILLLFGLNLVLGFIANAIQIDPEAPILFPILYILFFGLLCSWGLWQLNKLQINPKLLIGRLPKQYQWASIIGLVIIALLFSISAFLLSFYLISLVAPEFVEAALKSETLTLTSKDSSPFYNVLMAVVVVVIAPIAEEFIFRGLLLHRWAAKWGIRPALLLTAFVFGVLHANVLGLFVFGLIMGLLYIRTRTLLVPIACHALNNALAIGMGFLPDSPETQSLNSLEQLQSQWWMGLVLLALTAPWIIWFVRKNFPSRDTNPPYFANAADLAAQ